MSLRFDNTTEIFSYCTLAKLLTINLFMSFIFISGLISFSYP
ncbi:hypothetical protein EC950183_4010, partial [Escherichia coli 95.0183]